MWIWDCMVVALQATLGGIFWSILICLIGALAFGIFNYFDSKKKRPKYDGKPIIIDGGKE